MTGARPPRWAERFLESVGGNPIFVHDVLGDMADEFAHRAAIDSFTEFPRRSSRCSAVATPPSADIWRRGSSGIIPC